MCLFCQETFTSIENFPKHIVMHHQCRCRHFFTMHSDPVNQKSMEESKLLSRLSPILIICALRLGKHSLQLFQEFVQVGHISAGNKTNIKHSLRYPWLPFVYLLVPWKQFWPLGFLAFFLSIFFSLYLCINKKASSRIRKKARSKISGNDTIKMPFK